MINYLINPKLTYSTLNTLVSNFDNLKFDIHVYIIDLLLLINFNKKFVIPIQG